MLFVESVGSHEHHRTWESSLWAETRNYCHYQVLLRWQCDETTPTEESGCTTRAVWLWPSTSASSLRWRLPWSRYVLSILWILWVDVGITFSLFVCRSLLLSLLSMFTCSELSLPDEACHSRLFRNSVKSFTINIRGQPARPSFLSLPNNPLTTHSSAPLSLASNLPPASEVRELSVLIRNRSSENVQVFPSLLCRISSCWYFPVYCVVLALVGISQFIVS